MSYKNDHLLVIANKYGKASGDAKAELYETYDKIRDLSAGGTAINGMTGYGPFANAMLGIARLFAPSSFMPALDTSYINIPGTSYSSSISGGNSITSGGTSSFGYGTLGTYSAYPTGGAASILAGIGNSITSLSNDFTVGAMGSIDGITGGAAALTGAAASDIAGLASGLASTSSPKGSMLLPIAGAISGIGGLLSAVGPYFGPFGMLAGISGNMASGYAGSILKSYQSVQTRILNNADTILGEKVRNIETVCKQLDTQGDIIRKLIKDGADGDKNALQNLL